MKLLFWTIAAMLAIPIGLVGAVFAQRFGMPELLCGITLYLMAWFTVMLAFGLCQVAGTAEDAARKAKDAGYYPDGEPVDKPDL